MLENRETAQGSVRGDGDSDSLTERAHRAVRLVAERTATTDQVAELALTAAEQAVHPVGWYPPSLSHGQAGTALLHLYAARAGLGDRETAFTHIREAVLSTRVVPLENPGIFGGTSGLALALADCAADEPRFLPSLHRVHEQLAAQVLDTDYRAVERVLSDADYDWIGGAAGVLAYLATVEDPSPAVREAVRRLLDYLVWLSEPAQAERTPRRWLLVPDAYPPVGDYHARYPHGYLNLGYSHGVPGVAAALAAAVAAGHRHPGLESAVATLTSWILGHRTADEFGPLWHDGVPVDEHGEERPRTHGHDRIAWCYGTAGVASALLDVARATGDSDLLTTAVTAFEAVLRRAEQAGPLSPTLCHGQAGLLMMCRAFAPWSRLARERTPVLLDRLLDHSDEARPAVFADHEVPGNLVDDPGLLTGAAGVALAILAALNDDRPAWFRAFFAR
ncbi:Lanthionine synthetase C-like protein [Streptomyces sp. DI166]|uniref:lanthionine synthetase C family protein n=1 Tax=unclassified Streptomyces TaxID=2593676 RepID=UPI0007F45BFF|nr:MULTISPECIES: lanthionine synthetase C family protein [unclassified Streptomyces]SBT89782.1 Lanthionine synthetase C-like protein [Streptomyces sp. DI166]